MFQGLIEVSLSVYSYTLLYFYPTAGALYCEEAFSHKMQVFRGAALVPELT
jgi:hypothetical protein